MTILLVCAPSVHAGWAGSRVWDDGRAEVAFYDSERLDGDKPRQFREQVIISQEDLDADTLVKVDSKKGRKTIRAFKMNQVVRYESDNYPVTYLTSVFAAEDAPQQALKITMGAQDWTGNTFKILAVRAPDKATVEWHSQFDGEGDKSVELLLEPKDVFEDQLPLALRALPLKEGFQTEFRLWESLTSNRGREPRVSTAAVAVAGEDIIRGRAGSLPSWKVTVTRPGGVDTYWFEKAEPRILTRMETSDGRKRLLYGRSRWSYWDKRLPRPNILN